MAEYSTRTAISASAGIDVVNTAPQAPRTNAFAERRIAPVRRECTDRLLTTGERHLRIVLHAYVAHHNAGRSHQGNGLDPRAPGDAPNVTALPSWPNRIRRRQRLGGLVNEYEAAT
ncbi:integrase core domain-containing protein [Embleya sp. NPDC059267]